MTVQPFSFSQSRHPAAVLPPGWHGGASPSGRCIAIRLPPNRAVLSRQMLGISVPSDGRASCGSAWRGFARHAASDDRDGMPLYPADIFPHPSAVQEQGGGPLIQYWRFSIGGVVISRAAPEMQTDWQLSFKSGSLCLRHPPCCSDPANRHFMHYPAFFL